LRNLLSYKLDDSIFLRFIRGIRIIAIAFPEKLHDFQVAACHTGAGAARARPVS
jgi:hypothetical protein